MKKVSLQPAYVLHRRSYRESSLLVEIFTEEQGRLTVIAKGVRQIRSKTSGLLQPFVPLLISFSGQSELMLLTQVELNGPPMTLSGEDLFAGFYLNELLMHLLQKWDAHPRLFRIYQETVAVLHRASSHHRESALRLFEKYLLEELGYGVLPTTQVALEATLLADHHYRFVPGEGFKSAATPVVLDDPHVFLGQHLHDIAMGHHEEWHAETLKSAKRLMRIALSALLGSRPLHSRHLFAAFLTFLKRDDHETH